MRYLAVRNFDFLIIGGGVIGLTVARELQKRKLGSVAILEKEKTLGAHASGRNSGVIHAGLYYPPGTLKAKLCLEGARRLVDFALEHNISYRKNGKVVVAKNAEEQEAMEQLFQRAKQNGVVVEKVDQAQLAELEPEAKTHEWAIHSPNTGLIAPKEVLGKLAELFKADGGEFLFGMQAKNVVVQDKKVTGPGLEVGFGHLVNCAGMYADKIAHQFDVGLNYRILPFKGLYRKLEGKVAENCKMSIYPMPNLKIPFLGVHVTPQLSGKVFLGPTAQPAFGRENYSGLTGASFVDFMSIATRITPMVLTNQGKMRNLAFEEMSRITRNGFWKDVVQIAPNIQASDVGGYGKVGLRAQLVDIKKKELEMDFVVMSGENSTHVLNAVSPGLTASFAFSEHVVDQLI